MTSHELAKRLLEKPDVQIIIPNPSKYNTGEDIEYCVTLYSDEVNAPTKSTLLLRGASYAEEVYQLNQSNLAKENLLNNASI